MSCSVPKQTQRILLSSSLTDPVVLARDLIHCPSITPHEGGALTYLEACLTELGFICTRLPFSTPDTQEVDNLFAYRPGSTPKAPHLCFAGHTDVVAPGDLKSWTVDPFQGTIVDGTSLYGRGAVDMKGAIAAFVAAIARTPSKSCALSLLITGDEEGVAINGTRKVLEWVKQQNLIPDFCLVGEPTCTHHLGDTLKIGRRGSLNTVLTVQGIQGHVAFPERSRNPLPYLIKILDDLIQGPPEGKSTYFDPSNLEITSVDVGNTTTNLIPEKATARFNIRFNDQHTGDSLISWIKERAAHHTPHFSTTFEISGEAEFVEPNATIQALARMIQETTTVEPQLTTAGATSDARFIRHYCPVVEFGLVGMTMHQVNEHVRLQDLEHLTQIYEKLAKEFITLYSTS
jgi:succinyl-diaminopimelate desuccinylase